MGKHTLCTMVQLNKENAEVGHKLAMQVASMNPQWVTEDEIPEDKMKEAREAAEKTMTGKEPADKKEQILAAKVSKTFADRVLMSQTYIFDETKTVEQFIKDTIAKTGENITVKQFKRIELGVVE
jgi:elongation factor Ts